MPGFPDNESLLYWKDVLACADSRRPMRPEDVATLYAERPVAVSAEVSQQLVMGCLGGGSLPTSKFILCGSRGSGKSAELARIQQRLQEHYIPILVDLRDLVPEGAGSLAILLLAGAAGLATLKDWNRNFPGARWAEFRDQLGKAAVPIGLVVESTGVLVDQLGSLLAAGGGQEKALAFKVFGYGLQASGRVMANPQEAQRSTDKVKDILRQVANKRVDQLPQADRDTLLSTTNQILSALHDAAGRPALLLADGLDKWMDLGNILAALQDGEILAKLHCPAVFTGPVNLEHSTRFRSLRALFLTPVIYNVAVLDTRDPGHVQEKEEGIRFFLDVMGRRREQAGIAAEVFPEPALRHLARMSGGVVRDFLQLVEGAGRAALNRGDRAINLEDAKRSVTDFRHLLQLALTIPKIAVLKQVLKTRRFPGGDEAEDLLFENYILCYRNDDLWYRPSEVLVEYVRGDDL